MAPALLLSRLRSPHPSLAQPAGAGLAVAAGPLRRLPGSHLAAIPAGGTGGRRALGRMRLAFRLGAATRRWLAAELGPAGADRDRFPRPATARQHHLAPAL